MRTRLLLLLLFSPVLMNARHYVDSSAVTPVYTTVVEPTKDTVKQDPVISPKHLFKPRRQARNKVSQNSDTLQHRSTLDSSSVSNKVSQNSHSPQRKDDEPKYLDALKTLEERCDSLQKDLNALLPLRESLAEKMLKEYGNYFDGPFASIDSKVADSLVALCQMLKVPAVEGFIPKIEETMRRKACFDDLSKLKNSSYDKDAIQSAIVSLDGLKANSPDAQKKEIMALRRTLDFYSAAMRKTKELVATINETMGFYRPNGNKMAALSTLDAILQDYKQDISTYVNKNPYLKGLFDQMLKDLKANPLKQGAAETALLKMK